MSAAVWPSPFLTNQASPTTTTTTLPRRLVFVTRSDRLQRTTTAPPRLVLGSREFSLAGFLCESMLAELGLFTFDLVQLIDTAYRFMSGRPDLHSSSLSLALCRWRRLQVIRWRRTGFHDREPG